MQPAVGVEQDFSGQRQPESRVRDCCWSGLQADFDLGGTHRVPGSVVWTIEWSAA
jgi:hypothetical protein